MIEMMRPILEIAVIIPGMLLAYLSVKACLRQTPFKLVLWMFPLLLGISLSGGGCLLYFSDYYQIDFNSHIVTSYVNLSIKLFRFRSGNPVAFFWQSVQFLRA